MHEGWLCLCPFLAMLLTKLSHQGGAAHVCVFVWEFGWSVSHSWVSFSSIQITHQLEFVCFFKMALTSVAFPAQPPGPPAEDPRGPVVWDGLIGLPPDRRILRQFPRGAHRSPGHVLRPLWVKNCRTVYLHDASWKRVVKLPGHIWAGQRWIEVSLVTCNMSFWFPHFTKAAFIWN